MNKRQRTPPDTGEFRDPLSDYTPAQDADPLVRAISNDPVDAIEHQPFAVVDPQTTVYEAMTKMAEHNIACLVVVEDDKPVGIFSERDVLNRVADRFAELRDRPVSEVMTRDPIVVYQTDHPSRALNLMAEGGFRHLPLVDADRRIIGMIGPRRLTDYLHRCLEEV